MPVSMQSKWGAELEMPAIILCNVASVVRVFLASGAFIFLGIFQRAMLICDEEYVMRRIGDACDEYFGYRDDVLYVCSGNGCQRS